LLRLRTINAEASSPIRIISYNLRKNHASKELEALVAKYDADILCLQEAFTEELPDTLGALSLSHSTKLNRLGLAVYYRTSRFTAHDSRTLTLRKSLHDRLLDPTAERVVATRMFDSEAGREIIVSSFHASPLTASNSLRRHQIKAAHEGLREMGGDLPAVMVGDYNYPLFREKLSSHMTLAGYDLTLSDRPTYLRYKIFRGHFDFATSVGMTIDSVETLPQGKSDHLPIMVTASYKTVPSIA